MKILKILIAYFVAGGYLYLGLLFLAFALSGCVASYQHLSDPRIDDDGYDLLCGGVYYEYHSLTAKANVCSNVAPNGGEFVLASLEYKFSE